MKTDKVILDWTKETLVVDLINSLGEKYHFEIKPDEIDDLPTHPSTAPGSKTSRGVYVEMRMPLAVQLELPL